MRLGVGLQLFMSNNHTCNYNRLDSRQVLEEIAFHYPKHCYLSLPRPSNQPTLTANYHFLLLFVCLDEQPQNTGREHQSRMSLNRLKSSHQIHVHSLLTQMTSQAVRNFNPELDVLV